MPSFILLCETILNDLHPCVVCSLRHIAEVMDMTVNEACEFFAEQDFLYALQSLQRRAVCGVYVYPVI